ncbi:MAG TPA: hypothetical protein VGP72_28450 [Planctomycetota bacterium]|jgi:hypothetical protein
MLYAFRPLCLVLLAGLCFGTGWAEEPAKADAPKAEAVPAPAPKDDAKPADKLAEKPAADANAAKPVDAATAADGGAAEKEKVELSKDDQARMARDQARKLLAKEDALRAAVRKLSTPGWLDARAMLVEGGKASVPYLIDAMNPDSEEYRAISAFNLGGHVKADSGRTPRQRPLSEVCAEILTDMVSHHSSYKGDLPTYNAKEWQTWWTANAGAVTFGQ